MNESTLTIEETVARIRPVLAADDPELWRFVVTAFQQCVLGKVLPPPAPPG